MNTDRSYLYVPGSRADRLGKVFTRGADAVVADLEDSVAEETKSSALDTVDSWLESLDPATPGVWVRINAGARGLDELARIGHHRVVAGYFMPKVERAAQVAAVRDRLAALVERVRIAPIIESAAGLGHLGPIAAEQGVHQLHLGEMDVAADLGLEPDSLGTELAHIRSMVVIASRIAGLPAPAAPVSAVIDDVDGFADDTRRLRRMGFFGRDCIHPAQVGAVHEVFRPSDDDVAWAAQVLETARRQGAVFRGPSREMVDEAVLRRARTILGSSGAPVPGAAQPR